MEELQAAKQWAARRLAMKSYRSEELRAKMLAKFPEEVVELVIAQFTQFGYLNDEEWLKSQIRQQKSRNKGVKAILFYLLGKGIAREAAEKALQQEVSEEEQEVALGQWIHKKSRQYDPKDRKARDKLIASLLRKGFSYEMIKKKIQIIEYQSSFEE